MPLTLVGALSLATLGCSTLENRSNQKAEIKNQGPYGELVDQYDFAVRLKDLDLKTLSKHGLGDELESGELNPNDIMILMDGFIFGPNPILRMEEGILKAVNGYGNTYQNPEEFKKYLDWTKNLMSG